MKWKNHFNSRSSHFYVSKWNETKLFVVVSGKNGYIFFGWFCRKWTWNETLLEWNCTHKMLM
jgi:hypothetical protein